MCIKKTMIKNLATDPLISNNYVLAISLVFDQRNLARCMTVINLRITKCNPVFPSILKEHMFILKVDVRKELM